MIMSFSVGQVYYTQEGRQAIVLHTRSDGQEGLLRFVDTRVEEWLLWDDFRNEGKWHRPVGERG